MVVVVTSRRKLLGLAFVIVALNVRREWREAPDHGGVGLAGHSCGLQGMIVS